MKAAERFKMHYARPMPQGSGLPMVSSGQYKGIPLPAWIREKIEAYRRIPSLYGELK